MTIGTSIVECVKEPHHRRTGFTRAQVSSIIVPKLILRFWTNHLVKTNDPEV